MNQVFRMTKAIPVAAVVDGVPEVVQMNEGQTIRGRYTRTDRVTRALLIRRGADLWALPEDAVEVVTE